MVTPEALISDFLDELSSEKATPGGGAVSGLCGALGAALVTMVANLTLGRKEFSAVDEKMSIILANTKSLQKTFSKLASDDMVVYEEYLAALRMPKSSVDERRIRNAALAVRSKLIVSVPFEVAKQSVALAALALDVVENGNPHAIMEAGSAVKLAVTAAQIASNNVRFNLHQIKDEVFEENILTRLDSMIRDIESIGAATDKILEIFEEFELR